MLRVWAIGPSSIPKKLLSVQLFLRQQLYIVGKVERQPTKDTGELTKAGWNWREVNTQEKGVALGEFLTLMAFILKTCPVYTMQDS